MSFFYTPGFLVKIMTARGFVESSEVREVIESYSFVEDKDRAGLLKELFGDE